MCLIPWQKNVLVNVVIDRPQVGQKLGRHFLKKVCAPHTFQSNQSARLGILLKVVHNLFAVCKELGVQLPVIVSLQVTIQLF